MSEYEFVIPGRAVPQGSKTALKGKHQKFATVVDSNASKLRPFRAMVVDIAQRTEPKPETPIAGPVSVKLVFGFDRPGSHFTSKGAISASGRRFGWMTQKPDIDKLTRAILDALSAKTGAGWWLDDSQVVRMVVDKMWVGAGAAPFTNVFVVDLEAAATEHLLQTQLVTA